LIAFRGSHLVSKYIVIIQVVIVRLATYAYKISRFTYAGVVLDCVSQLYHYTVVHFVRTAHSFFDKSLLCFCYKSYNIIMTDMGNPEHSSDSSDFATAKALNESVGSIFSIIRLYQLLGPMEEFNAEELNRTYLFLVNELEVLYDRNPKLTEIQPEPMWRKFEVIKNKMHDIEKYLEENPDHDHMMRLDKLCILSEQAEPNFTLKQQKYVDEAKALYDKYMALVIQVVEKLPVDNSQEEREKDPRNLRVWCIPKYTVEYKLDGTILVNGVMKLKKIHAGSTAERLLEQAAKHPNTLCKPDLGQTARNLSTVISSAGFTPTLRELFFPIVSDDKGFIFRPTLIREQALEDRIDTFELDKQLYVAGAEIAVRPEEELIALGLARPDDED
jgi:hypothetical protein